MNLNLCRCRRVTPKFILLNISDWAKDFISDAQSGKNA